MVIENSCCMVIEDSCCMVIEDSEVISDCLVTKVARVGCCSCELGV